MASCWPGSGKPPRRSMGNSSPLRTSDMLYFMPLIWAAAQPPTQPPVKDAAASVSKVAPVEPLPPPKLRHALILCGHPGDAEHVKSFTETVRKLRDGLA